MLEAPARVGVRDSDIGIQGFLTPTPALGGRLKVRIEDFHVEETGPGPPPEADGRFTAARIRLANWETNQFVREASGELEISRKKIHFSGTKDKRGVTTQWFTFEAPAERVRGLGKLGGVEVVAVHRTNAELSLGDHEGNAFHVVLRDVEGPEARVRSLVEETARAIQAAGGVPNFFGPQRFGTVRATTHRVGEAILRGDFEGAVLRYLSEPGPGEAPEAAGFRQELAAKRDWKAALARPELHAGFDRALLHRLAETNGDYLEALRSLPENLQWLFVSAFQSFLFNQILSRRLAHGLPLDRAVEGDLVAPVERGSTTEEWIPVTATNRERVDEALAKGRAAVTGLLPGTQTPAASGAMGEIERAVMREANVEPRDFLIPEHLPWSSKGTRRALLCPVHDLRWELAADDLHPGRWLVRFDFALPRGSYATTVLREFMKSPWQDDYA